MSWQRLPFPIKIATGFGTLGLLLTGVGIVRGNIPAQPINAALALLIGGGVWSLVSWAVAATVYEVEQDEKGESVES